MAQMFGRYELRQLLGRGGMGEVYRAFDTERQREVAIKLLPESLAADPQFEARFRRESLLAAQLNEPHIVPIHDFGEIDGRLYIDMRLVEGEDLGSVLSRTGPMAPRIAADVIRQVAAALDAAHRRGLVHRDVKPSNVMLTGLSTQFPFAYLVDFGIARSADQLTALTTTSSSTVGTIAYMAPERINAEPFDQRADVYALACVLYEALTASLPFGGDVVAIMYAHMSKPPPRASERVPGIPPELDEVIARGMAKDPAQRYPSAGELGYAAIAAASRAPSVPHDVPWDRPDTQRTDAQGRRQDRPDTSGGVALPPPTGRPVDVTPPPGTPPPGTPPPGSPPPGTTSPGRTPSPVFPPAAYPPTAQRPAYQAAPDARRTGPSDRPSTPPPNHRTPPPNHPTPPPGYQSWGAPPPRRPERNRRKIIAIAAAVVAAAALAIVIPIVASGNGGSPSGGGTGSPVPTGSRSSSSAGTTTFHRGGTLQYAAGAVVVTSWDPQRTYIASDISNEQRLFVRTLVQFGSGSGTSSFTLHPDLATSTGTMSNNAETWTFTLKNGIKWQDGSPVTCDDVRYGISRTFDQDIITGGPTYALQFLNVPSGTYKGPYQGTGQDVFDKAIECSGQTITFHLSKPVPDFNYALTLPAFAPYKKSQDQGAKSNYAVFSDGPYKLAAPWVSGHGGTFVRNPQYDPSTDDTTIRRALPDKIVFTESGETDAHIYQRLLADAAADQNVVTDRKAPPAVLTRAQAQGSRFSSSDAGFVYYVAPNFARLTNPAIRQALAQSTDRTAFITAGGGSTTAEPAYGLVPPVLGAAGGYKSFRAFDVPDTGDPTAAMQTLAQAGVTTPVQLRMLYIDGPSSTPQAKALAAAWDNAGFHIALIERDDAYAYVSDPHNSSQWDLFVTAWGPDWPSASTVIPPVFDSRINLSSVSNGADIGRYSSSLVNAQISEAYSTLDATQRNARWAALDEELAQDVAYIPLSVSKAPRLHGSKVTNYIESASTNGYPDLGQIGVSS